MTRSEQLREAQAAYKAKMKKAGFRQKTVWVNTNDYAMLQKTISIVNAETPEEKELIAYLRELKARLDYGKQGRPKSEA